MSSAPELLKRSQYFTPPNTEHTHSSRTHFFDWQEYHRPFARMHHAHLHDWGIASGLAISVVEGGLSVEVQPGVAIDSSGELIALSASGQADISLAQPGETGQQIPTPFRLNTGGMPGEQRYLTIQFAERLRFGEGAGGKLEQTPWLRLQPTATYVNDGVALILALVTVDGAGVATVSESATGLPHSRRLISNTSEALQLQRATTVAGSVQESVAARLEPGANGGLRVTVPETSDTVLFSQQGGGNFSALEVRANDLRTQGNLQVTGNLTVQANLQTQGNSAVQGDLQVNGALRVNGPSTLAGNVTVGAAATPAKLTVNGPLQLQSGVAITEFSTDGALAGNSDSVVPTEQAVKEYVDNLLVGSVTAFATAAPPPGWLECNGQAISRIRFARLFARIGTTFGAGDGANTFNVPDLRGIFVRGWDQGSGRDPGRGFGTYQADGFQNHYHYFYGNFATIGGGWHEHVHHSGGFWSTVKLAGGGNSAVRQYVEGAKTWGEVHSHGYTPSGSVSYAANGNALQETRSKNTALLYCIKQ